MSKAARSISNGSSSSRQPSPMSLPPMISPTLPSWVDEIPESNIPPRMLSPTLPPVYGLDGKSSTNGNGNKSKKRDISSTTSTTHNGTSTSNSNDPPLLHPVPRRAGKQQFSKVIGGESHSPSISPAPSLPPKPQPRRQQQQQQEQSSPSFMVTLRLSSSFHSRYTSNGREKKPPTGLGITDKSKRKSSTSTPISSSATAKRQRISREYSSSSDDNNNNNNNIEYDDDDEDIPLKAAAIRRVQNSSNTSTPNTTPKLKSSSSVPPIPKRPESGAANSSSPKSSTRKRTNNDVKNSGTNNDINNDDSHEYNNTNENKNNNNEETNGTPKAPDANERMRNNQIQALRTKMNNWVRNAQDLKHKADKAARQGKHEQAGVLMMDSVFAFFVGFDYEDRLESFQKRISRPHSWSSMIPFISRTATMFEPAVDSKIMIGLCYQLRGVVQLRLAAAFQQQIKRYSNDSSVTKEQLMSYVSKHIQCCEGSAQDFKRGFHELPLETIRKEFPNTWTKRQQRLGTSNKEGGYRPQSDLYYLPLHSFSTVQEAAAFGYNATKEWADKNKVPYESCLLTGF